MPEAARHLPLDGRRFAAAGIALDPCPPAGRLSLRARADAVPALSQALGVELPSRPNTSASAGGVTAMRLGPDEWLVIGEAGLAGRLAKLSGVLFSAVDVSHRNTAVTVSGPLATAIINSGCPLDLSLAAFGVGRGTRTIYGKTEIVLLREAEDRFRIECWRSFSDYLWKFLVDAAKSAAPAA